MKKKDLKNIKRKIILGGNFIISILLLLSIKNNNINSMNIYRYNLICIFMFIMLNMLNMFIIKIKNYKGGVN